MSSLKDLSTEELLELNQWLETLTPREKDTVINGFSTKAGYHVLRLALECEEMLNTGNLHLDQNAAVLSSVRRGEWTFERLEQWFETKERHLEECYHNSKLPQGPDEDAIKALLLKVLEEHYGDLKTAVVRQTNSQKLVQEMQALLDRYR
jgi:hypothetical protein